MTVLLRQEKRFNIDLTKLLKTNFCSSYYNGKKKKINKQIHKFKSLSSILSYPLCLRKVTKDISQVEMKDIPLNSSNCMWFLTL